MTANRTRKEHQKYIRYNKSLKGDKKCIFCDLKKGDPQYISETKHFFIIRNIFPYSLWDDMKVVDHLMLVPKQHTDTLAVLSKEAAVEYVNIISEYEQNSYGIWARPVGSVIKSIEHQHTHFIKGDGKRGKFLLHSRKPYTRISF